MGTRTISRKRRGAGENRTIVAIIAAIVGPMLLTCVLIALDMRTDLSDLKPRQSLTGHEILVGWPDLRPNPAARIRMLGYMMENGQARPEGAPVNNFVLMAEAGHLLHPAHRDPGEMVTVRLLNPVPYRYRSLVWVTGSLWCGNGTCSLT